MKLTWEYRVPGIPSINFLAITVSVQVMLLILSPHIFLDSPNRLWQSVLHSLLQQAVLYGSQVKNNNICDSFPYKKTTTILFQYYAL